MYKILSQTEMPCYVVGNFLADMYAALWTVHCSIMLSTNHRSESQLIVDNAKRISQRQCPIVDTNRRFCQSTIDENTDGSHQYPEYGRWQHLFALNQLKNYMCRYCFEVYC